MTSRAFFTGETRRIRAAAGLCSALGTDAGRRGALILDGAGLPEARAARACLALLGEESQGADAAISLLLAGSEPRGAGEILGAAADLAAFEAAALRRLAEK